MARYVICQYRWGYCLEMDPTDSVTHARRDLASLYGGKGFVYDRVTGLDVTEVSEE